MIWVLDWGHIRCCGNGHLWFRSYSGSLLANAPKVTKRSLPHHSVPRLGSACPHSGTPPRAAATGHPWPGAAKSASLPIYPLHRACLRPSWLTGPADQDQKPDQQQEHSGLPAGLSVKSKSKNRSENRAAFLWELACLRYRQLGFSDTPRRCHRRQASSHIWTVPALDFDFALQHSSRPVGRCALAVDLDFDLRRPVKPRWPNAGFGAWVTRQDAGLAVLGQGWPMTAAHGPKPE
ncbi:hypothetical protein SAMN05216237_5985 [Pseudomonas yamanorum]|nr:hypothetical protein SAMN05216237_5985 [Pseudomonas yamanorum]